MRMSKRVTIKDVADHVGVSYQTVSKVLNNKGQVSKETEERIWEAVRSLGYRPNHIARSLRSRRTKMIGYAWPLSAPNQINPILDQFIQSMLQVAKRAGYYILCFPHRMDEDVTDSYLELIDTNRVDGFVVSELEFDDRRVPFLLEHNIPFVAFGRSNPEWDFPFVDVDGTRGIYLVTKHLLNNGHRRIALLGWPESSRVGRDRFQGYVQALEEAGLPLNSEWIKRGDGEYSFGDDAAAELLEAQAKERVTAIIALNDAVAIGAMHAVEAKGLQVGADIAITGFDDSPMVHCLAPPLTSVRQPVWDVGQRVIEMMLALLEGEELEERKVILPPELVVRESSLGVNP
jgi:DNA-binding LacI/PurR family transcriptional regulator